jgi:hypothetical protein
MANWGYAISQGLAGGANAIGILADQQLKEDAETRAANRQLDIQMRLDAARELGAQRAAEYKQAQAAKRAQEINAGADGSCGPM